MGRDDDKRGTRDSRQHNQSIVTHVGLLALGLLAQHDRVVQLQVQLSMENAERCETKYYPPSILIRRLRSKAQQHQETQPAIKGKQRRYNDVRAHGQQVAGRQPVAAGAAGTARGKKQADDQKRTRTLMVVFSAGWKKLRLMFL
jgi:hypothetical protein